MPIILAHKDRQVAYHLASKYCENPKWFKKGVILSKHIIFPISKINYIYNGNRMPRKVKKRHKKLIIKLRK